MSKACGRPAPDPQRMAAIRKTILSRYDQRIRNKRIAGILAALCTVLTLLLFLICKKEYPGFHVKRKD